MKKQRLGQNFLINENIAREIIEQAGVTNDQNVLEIGPGKGILTAILIKKTQSLTAIEIDPKLCLELTNRFKKDNNFQLIQSDAIKYDYSKLMNRYQIISNLPYYAATHILKRLIHYRKKFTSITVMLQKEVVDRLVATPESRNYGSLSIFIQFYCDVERRMEVDKESFSPKPKIDSSVIKLTPLENPRVKVDSLKTFFSVVNASFLHKRKMLKNNLTEWNNLFDSLNGKIELAGIDLNRRGETLSIEDFAKLSNHIYAYNDKI
jgi:16S rRNA (adenine1518-N6/adenine1519-N6)-dimethyltransferase